MRLLKSTIFAFLNDDCPRMAAALSYYTMFSLPALLILVMLMAGLIADPQQIRGRILMQIQTLIGPSAAEQVRVILENASGPGSGGPLTIVVGLVTILFAATTAFAQLQNSLNRVWEVDRDPEHGDVRNFLWKRVFSFGMIIAVALLLLISILAQSLLAGFGRLVTRFLPPSLTSAGLQTISLGLTWVVAIVLFAAIFRIVPDAVIRWRDAAVGSVLTATLFVLGNLLLGLWFARGGVGSAFGAAGSLALILVWIYYSAMIFFLGAELTQALARNRGEEIRPSKGAVRIVYERNVIRDEGAAAGAGTDPAPESGRTSQGRETMTDRRSEAGEGEDRDRTGSPAEDGDRHGDSGEGEHQRQNRDGERQGGYGRPDEAEKITESGRESGSDQG